jgi:hypothetical protein
MPTMNDWQCCKQHQTIITTMCTIAGPLPAIAPALRLTGQLCIESAIARPGPASHLSLDESQQAEAEARCRSGARGWLDCLPRRAAALYWDRRWGLWGWPWRCDWYGQQHGQWRRLCRRVRCTAKTLFWTMIRIKLKSNTCPGVREGGARIPHYARQFKHSNYYSHEFRFVRVRLTELATLRTAAA